MKASAPRSSAFIVVHSAHGRMAISKLGEDLEPVAIRQGQIQQHQLDVRIVFDLPHRLARIRCLQDVQSFALQLPEDDTQCLTDEDMIVDNKDLHDACLKRLSHCHHT
jgi:hypothetical protein